MIKSDGNGSLVINKKVLTIFITLMMIISSAIVYAVTTRSETEKLDIKILNNKEDIIEIKSDIKEIKDDVKSILLNLVG